MFFRATKVCKWGCNLCNLIVILQQSLLRSNRSIFLKMSVYAGNEETKLKKKPKSKTKHNTNTNLMYKCVGFVFQYGS